MAGDGGKLWVTAERQLQGKGSRGRVWVSEAGNFYGSLLLRDAGNLDRLHTLTFVVSLAIRDAIYGLNGAQFTKITLKWPNDVLLNGKKTSGILLESHEANGARYCVIGMGVNIAHHPDETLHPATHLAKEGIVADREVFFAALSNAIEKRLVQWSRGDGFESIRQDWLKAAHGIGLRMETKLPGATTPVCGTFRGIDDNGLLILAGAGGREQRVSVADIFFA